MRLGFLFSVCLVLGCGGDEDAAAGGFGSPCASNAECSGSLSCAQSGDLMGLCTVACSSTLGVPCSERFGDDAFCFTETMCGQYCLHDADCGAMQECDPGGFCRRGSSDEPTMGMGQLWVVRCPGEETIINGQAVGGDSCSHICATDIRDAADKLAEFNRVGAGAGSIGGGGNCMFVDFDMPQGVCMLGVFPQPGTPEFDYQQALCDQYVFND